jgi:hypothetical protein
MKSLLVAMACTAFAAAYGQEECCEEPKTYPRNVYHSHVEDSKTSGRARLTMKDVPV